MKLFHSLCEDYGIVHNNDRIFEYLGTFEDKEGARQMRLFE